MESVVCDAIKTRKLLSFGYGGTERLVEPYVHGVTARGKEVIHGFQREGGSKSGREVGWKLFVVANTRNLRVTDVEFRGLRDDFRSDGTYIESIHCIVSEE